MTIATPPPRGVGAEWELRSLGWSMMRRNIGVLTDDPHAEGGENGEECEDEDGSHRVILKREIDTARFEFS